MELSEILCKLYSQNKTDILNVINSAYHASIEDFSGAGRCIHTGFYCKTHKGKILGFIYCIDNKELYFQGNSSLLLGAYMLPSKPATFFENWLVVQKPNKNEHLLPYYHCIEYDLTRNSLRIDLAIHISEQNTDYIIRGANYTWNQFSIIDSNSRYDFKIRKSNIETFYCGGEHRFRL